MRRLLISHMPAPLQTTRTESIRDESGHASHITEVAHLAFVSYLETMAQSLRPMEYGQFGDTPRPVSDHILISSFTD